MQKIVSFLTAIVMTLSGFFFPGSSGQIYLLGESHGDSSIMAVELETWDRYYQQGMRHLFIEWPYYDAEFLNLWMQAEDDAILTQLFEDMANTAAAQPIYWDYWHTFKEKYPETVFHGTDIGHTYQNSGPRYLRYLEQTGQKDSEAYRITLEVIEQGRAYYEDHGGSYAFREPLMVHNFQRAYDALPAGTSIMGIYGAAHTNPGDTVEGTSNPNMASQLQEIYGDRLHTTDLTAYTIDDSQTGQTQPVTIGGQDFTAVQVLRAVRQSTGESYTYWLVPDAYTAALGQPRNEVFFPISNFPAALEVGQVFLYDHGLPDGSTERFFYYYDGSQYLDVQVAWGFGADLEPLQIGQTRTLTIAGKDYTAVNQGTTDLSVVFPQYRSRTFWLVRDAYGDVKNLPAIANMLPYDNYPDDVEEGQVWAIEYTLPDGSIQWEYYRADGAFYNGRPATTQFEG